jgi:hypothetical protein
LALKQKTEPKRNTRTKHIIVFVLLIMNLLKLTIYELSILTEKFETSKKSIYHENVKKPPTTKRDYTNDE